MEGGPITTVVPATTASALTSIATGLAPAQHGILGYRMLVGGEVLNVLRWTVSGGGRAPDPFDVQRHTAFLGRPVPVVTRSEFRDVGFHRRRTCAAVTSSGWHTTSALVEHCLRAVEAGERFVYAYYPGVDSVAHEFGLHARVYRRELAAADALVGALLDALPERAALLVTADHGQVHLEPESWIAVPELGALTDRDGRRRPVPLPPRAQGRGARAARPRRASSSARSAWVWSRAELLDEELLGTGATGSVPGPHRRRRARRARRRRVRRSGAPERGEAAVGARFAHARRDARAARRRRGPGRRTEAPPALASAGARSRRITYM